MTSAAKRAGRNAGSVIFVFLVIIFVTWNLIQTDRVLPPVPSTNLQPSSKKIVEGLFGFKDAMAWSPNSKYVAIGTFINGGQKGQLLVFDASSGKNVLTYYSHTNGIYAVTWSPDGKQIAAGTSDQTIHIIDVGTGRHLLTYTGRKRTSSNAIQLAWSPDGRYIAESIDRIVQLRNMNSGQPGSAIIDNDAQQLLWSRDGRSLGIAVQKNSMVKEIQIWDAISGQKLHTIQGDMYSGNVFAWSPDGKRIARPYAFGVVHVWDVVTGNLLLTHGVNDPSSLGNIVRSVDWSPDGRYIVSATGRFAVAGIEMWDANTGQTITTYKNYKQVNGILWSPDGRYMMAAEEGGTLEVWETPN